MNLKDVPIKRKLTAVIMLTSSVALLLTSVAFIVYEYVTFRSTILHNSQTVAQITAANSTAALTFKDSKTATEILSKLQAEETVLRASVYDQTNQLFALYPTNAPPEGFPVHTADGYRFEKGVLQFFVPVREGQNRLGTLFLETDLLPMYRRLSLYGGIVVLVLVSSLLVALLLSNWLQKRISQPILELAETAKAVSVKRDYLVRARKYGNDELGLLTDAFNHMLTQIHDRDAALRESEERLRLALEASGTGTWDWDVESGKIRWDNSLYRLYGLKVGEFDGTYETFIDLVHPEDRAAVSRQVKRALEIGGEFISEFRIFWPDKSIHYLASRGKAFYQGDKATEMSGVTLDITENREAAEALSLLAAIVESSDDAIVGKTLEGKIVSWNAGAERMFGHTAKEAVGHGIDFIIPRNRLREETRMLERIRAGYIEHFETVRVRKDGKPLHVSLTVSPIRNSEGKIIGASSICRDISERIRAEEEIRALNAELEERVLRRTSELAETNKELEAFTYTVSHDLRAPLRHIDAFAQILEEQLQAVPDVKVQRYIDRIRHGVQNMGQLVDDLLNLSRAGRQELLRQHCDLNALVAEVLADFKPELEKRTVEWHIGNLPCAQCDRGLMKQVFANLISNAVKYTRPREKAVIEIGAQTIEGEPVIFIRDNGVGFNMKYAHKLFGVFQRLHRTEDFEGTGVGLATVQRIIHLHQGRIWANAELDKGATFYFTLKEMERA